MDDFPARAFIETGKDQFKALKDCEEEELQTWLNAEALNIERHIHELYGTFSVAVKHYKMRGLVWPSIELLSPLTEEGGEQR